MDRTQPDQKSPAFSADFNRRGFLKASGLTIGGISLASLIAACSSGSGGSNGGTLTLRLPFLEEMQVPDPDIFYEGEGVQVMESAYEGLVRYKSGTAQIIPGLAKSWTVSGDLLTYTFTLQPGVKFHDGTAADAAAWIKSFERRKAINQGPSYMVEGVAKMAALDATTFVVTLKSPNNAFLHYLACPWQPFATSPAAVAKHAAGGDMAQGWLQTHDAGTGPYVFEEFLPGSHYILRAFPDYWGEKPAFKTVVVTITPSISTQELELDAGALDLVTKGFAVTDVLQYQKNPQFRVINALGGTGEALWLNPTSGVFANKELRRAMLTALDRKTIVGTAWGGLTTPQAGLWPEQTLSSELAPFPSEVNTAPLKALVSKLKLGSTPIDLAWGANGGAPRQQMADLIQVQLAALGLNVTVREMPVSVLYDLEEQPPSKRPDLLVAGIGGDALHLDTTLRILLRTGAKPLNLFQYSNPELDKLMDLAVRQPTVATMDAVYQQCSRLILDDAIFIPLCVPPNSTIAHRYVTGIEDNSFFPPVFWPQAIKKV